MPGTASHQHVPCVCCGICACPDCGGEHHHGDHWCFVCTGRGHHEPEHH